MASARQVPVKLPKVPVSSSFFGVSVATTDVPQSSVSSRPRRKMVGVKVMAAGFSIWVFKEGSNRKQIDEFQSNWT